MYPALASQAETLYASVGAAARYRGATSPNPPVGAAALDANGRLLGIAAHERAGTPHAEAKLIAELRAQGKLAEVHTLLITLEPCNHTGRTPPCTRAILEAGIPHVIYGAPDPNPRVAGGGAQALREVGVNVELVTDATAREACAELIAPFKRWSTTGLPYVTVKTAWTGNSMIPPQGRKTFTSEFSLKLAHELRRRADAIITGSGTVLADDPEFTVRRVPDHPGRRPRILVVMDRRGRVPADWLNQAENRGFEVWVRHDAREAIKELGECGALEVLVEAGPSLSGFFLSEGLWQEHVLIRKSNLGEADTIDVYRNRPEDRPNHE
jgi:diaminohydroxyphosphoribosylaminopyrimidine deaminase/5-amino-6-(5-phosphoribosylamino)uracil reductase